MSLEVRPEHRHLIPEVATRTRRTCLCGSHSSDFQVGIVPGLGWPFRVATAVRVAGFREAHPIADDPPLNGEISLRRAVPALPREEERVLNGVICAERLQLRIVFERVIEDEAENRLSLRLG